MEGIEGRGKESKIRISSRTKYEVPNVTNLSPEGVVRCLRNVPSGERLQCYFASYGRFSVAFPCNMEERDNTGMLEKGWGMFCAYWKELGDNQPVQDNICTQRRGKNVHVSVGKANVWVYGGEQLHRYIYTKGRHTRGLRMHRIHKCHKPAHQGGKKNFAAVWLDLANAYGSVPHQLIESAMELYHIYTRECPGDCQELLWWFTVDDYTTSWQRLEKEIVSGCTMSPILFVMVMDMVTRATTVEKLERTINKYLRKWLYMD